LQAPVSGRTPSVEIEGQKQVRRKEGVRRPGE
jgi:hypothetical protein